MIIITILFPFTCHPSWFSFWITPSFIISIPYYPWLPLPPYLTSFISLHNFYFALGCHYRLIFIYLFSFMIFILYYSHIRLFLAAAVSSKFLSFQNSYLGYSWPSLPSYLLYLFSFITLILGYSWLYLSLSPYFLAIIFLYNFHFGLLLIIDIILFSKFIFLYNFYSRLLLIIVLSSK